MDQHIVENYSYHIRWCLCCSVLAET